MRLPSVSWRLRGTGEDRSARVRLQPQGDQHNRRPRYNDLVKRLRSATRDRRELPDGYAFKLDSKAVSVPEVAEWISMERLCCPFLTLQLSASG
jgi:hypothetical protein